MTCKLICIIILLLLKKLWRKTHTYLFYVNTGKEDNNQNFFR